MIHVYLYYQVEFGDTMLDIAFKFKLNMAELMKLNYGRFVERHRDINAIVVGELIRIQ